MYNSLNLNKRYMGPVNTKNVKGRGDAYMAFDQIFDILLNDLPLLSKKYAILTEED